MVLTASASRCSYHQSGNQGSISLQDFGGLQVGPTPPPPSIGSKGDDVCPGRSKSHRLILGLQKQPPGFAELTPRQEILALNYAIHALASLAHPGSSALAMGTILGKWSQG